MKYRQSGLSVEAIQWDGNADTANEFIGEAYGIDWEYVVDNDLTTSSIEITVVDSINKKSIAKIGYWIVKVVGTQLHVYSNDKFHEMFELESGWKPIDTAPKDGTNIIICIAGITRSSGEAYWYQNENGSNGGWQTWDGENHKRTVYITQPTHWMPLPQAPGA